MTQDKAATALTTKYAKRIQPLLTLSKQAYGSRDTVSPQHDASRKYTALLVEYVDKGGSIPAISKALGVTQAGVRRRVSTATLTPSQHRARPKLPKTVYVQAVRRIKAAKKQGTEAYHDALLKEYEDGLSLTKMAEIMGLSSANPLYYGSNRAKLRRDGN